MLDHSEGGLVHDLKQEIEKLNFRFLYSDSGKFITSSCPACIVNLCNDQTFAYLPLSPHLSVCFGKDVALRKMNNRMKKISAEDAISINEVYKFWDTKQVRYFIGNSDSTLQEYLSLVNNS